VIEQEPAPASMIATDDRNDRLLGEVQRTLACLADAHMRREVEREQIAAWPGPAADKERRSSACDRRYRLACKLSHQRLDELRQRVRSRAAAGSWSKPGPLLCS
jgi:hypothetical protein